MDDGIQCLITKWQLVNIRPFMRTSATYNYVAIVYSQRYKSDLVLKVGSKSIIELEQHALQIFQGSNCVKLIDFDEEKNGLLLEFLHQGVSLKDLFLGGQEKKAIEVFADVVQKLHRGDNFFELNKFKTVEQRLDLLHRFQSNKISDCLLDRSRKISESLVKTQGQMYLLHGDLHHENILQRGNEWVIIDPQAVIGELEYEVGIFMCNPMFALLQQKNFLQFVENRFNIVSELLNFDKQRLIDWSFVQSVLAACYSEQDNQEDALEYFISIAEAFEKL